MIKTVAWGMTFPFRFVAALFVMMWKNPARDYEATVVEHFRGQPYTA